MITIVSKISENNLSSDSLHYDCDYPNRFEIDEITLSKINVDNHKCKQKLFGKESYQNDNVDTVFLEPQKEFDFSLSFFGKDDALFSNSSSIIFDISSSDQNVVSVEKGIKNV